MTETYYAGVLIQRTVDCETKYVHEFDDGSDGGGGSDWADQAPPNGDGSTTTPEKTPLEKLEAIADLSLIPDDLQDELKQALEETIRLMDENCVGRWILNNLINANATVKFKYDPNFNYTAGYLSNNNEFILSSIDSWYSTQLFIHELTHALQDALYPEEIMNNASTGLRIGMIQLELEAHVIEDLSRSGSGTEAYKKLSNERKLQFNYENRILRKIKNNDPINMDDFNSLLGPFGEYYDPEYNTPPNLDFEPALFKVAFSNCLN